MQGVPYLSFAHRTQLEARLYRLRLCPAALETVRRLDQIRDDRTDEIPMKITIEVDCTPEEGRRFLGLPDVAPMQQAMMEKVQQHVASAIDSATTETLLRAWMPMAPDQMQQAFAKLFGAFGRKES